MIIEFEYDEAYLRIDDLDYQNICNKLIEIYNPIGFLNMILDSEY